MKRLGIVCSLFFSMLFIACTSQSDWAGKWYAYDGQGRTLEIEFKTGEYRVSDQFGATKTLQFSFDDMASEQAPVLVMENGRKYRLVYMDQKKTVAQLLDEAENVVYTLTRFQLSDM